ncbi:indoleacetamide hydrolase [Streptomyces sp. NPDC057271]|uniref:indoleacetamide hydrolase n=1 Tax=unclassified Streptomyces TaxID=2593676 RepID=UPI0036322154
MDCIEWTLREAVSRIACRDVTVVEYTDQLLRRCGEQARLNAFISLPVPEVRRAAREADRLIRRGEALGPLHGIPLVVKDNIDVAGMPTTGGTPALRAHRPPRSAPVVSSLLRAGALVLGKSNMHELAYGVTGDNAAFGPVRNPYDNKRLAGGSSSGTAAAVSARLAPAGLGTDTGGSVRIPAALCGVAGLRPSMGRYSQRGVMILSPTRDTVGPMARNVSDLALLDAVLTGQPHAAAVVAPSSPLRIGVPRNPCFRSVDRSVTDVVERRLAQLEEHGATLIEVDLPPRVEELTAAAGFPIVFHETPPSLTRYLRATEPAMEFAELVEQVASADVREMLGSLLPPGAVDPAVYGAALGTHRPELEGRFAHYFRQNDLSAIAFPTVPVTACQAEETSVVPVNGTAEPTFLTYIRNTNVASVIGWPGLSVPAGLDANGLPVGIELDGPPGSEALLLSLGRHCEELWGPLPAPATHGETL